MDDNDMKSLLSGTRRRKDVRQQGTFQQRTFIEKLVFQIGDLILELLIDRDGYLEGSCERE